MKKMSFKLMIALMGAFMFIFSGCKDDDDNKDNPAEATVPVLGTDFSFIIAGNDVTLSTTRTGNVWFTNVASATNHNVVDGKVIVKLPLKGTYEFTCSVLEGGVTLTSEKFEIEITEDDLSFLNEGIWKALTGGENGDKTWVLDLIEIKTERITNAGVKTEETAYKSAYFHNALDFYGDEDAGGSATDIWGPWGGTNIYGWGGTPEAGEIKFNGVTKTVTFDLIAGVNTDGGKDIDATERSGTFSGSFELNVYERDPNFLTLTNDTKQTLWENMLTGHYNNIGELSAEMADLTMEAGIRFPMDNGRVGEGQFLDEDMSNVVIMHASDSALIIRVKRTYEGFNDDGSKKPNACWLLYNYRVKGYDYGVRTPPTHPVKSITSADLVGAWKLADVPGNWIGWAGKNQLNEWADAAAVTTLLAAWGDANVTEKLASTTKVSLVFSDNGNVTIKDYVYSDVETETTYTTTYTVSNGYVTFGDDVVLTGFSGRISLTGKNIYAMDVAGSTTGIWLGQNNEDKEESLGVHIVKVQ
jgi:hypothetical protein